ELDVELALVGSAEDHLADRPRMVVDIAHASREPPLVERRRTAEPDLLHRREEQLHPRVRATVFHQARRSLEHRGYRSLVVGAEDRAGGVADDFVLADDRLD